MSKQNTWFSLQDLLQFALTIGLNDCCMLKPTQPRPIFSDIFCDSRESSIIGLLFRTKRNPTFHFFSLSPISNLHSTTLIYLQRCLNWYQNNSVGILPIYSIYQFFTLCRLVVVSWRRSHCV